MAKKWIRNVIKGLSFTSVMFIFQACYGTPQDMEPVCVISGTVVSAATNEPIGQVQISQDGKAPYWFSNELGKFDFVVPRKENMKFVFEDPDPANGGSFLRKDTVFSTNRDMIEIKIKLEGK